MRPAKRDMDPLADSHAGRHGDFTIKWFENVDGWWIICHMLPIYEPPIGPFHTSQAAFGAVKDAIDVTIEEDKMSERANIYFLQQQNSVTKGWVTILETTYTEAEKNFQNLVTDPDNKRYGHKYRVLEATKLFSN